MLLLALDYRCGIKGCPAIPEGLLVGTALYVKAALRIYETIPMLLQELSHEECRR